jgi:hypothetical protein
MMGFLAGVYEHVAQQMGAPAAEGNPNEETRSPNDETRNPNQ